ncbi:MAG: hypothetical protein Q7T81_05140 [Pseudolabrys sp.]|nr:hypothetical protein [Pseudolabrys sp.]
MDQPKDTAATGNSATPEPTKTPEIKAVSSASAPETLAPKAAISDLPSVESPSISPADLVKTADSDLEPAATPIPELAIDAQDANTFANEEFQPLPAEPKRALLRPRHKRYAVLAASVAIAAAMGGVIGALATGGSPTPPPVNVAAVEEAKAMQASMAKLAKEVTTLKANLEEANKVTRAQVAKIETKIESKVDSKIAKLDERLKKEAEEVTGSILAPQTVAAVAPPAAVAAAPVPVPTPRPATRMAAPEQPLRLPVVPGWSIHDTRGGYIYVESRGEVYQISPGAPLPGIGQVESIKRLDGRWVVKTPKGIIVAARDRRYFE